MIYKYHYRIFTMPFEELSVYFRFGIPKSKALQQKIFLILLCMLSCVAVHTMEKPITLEWATILDSMIPTNPSINAKNNLGNTRLHLAVCLSDKNDTDTCKLLIRQGTNIFLENNQGQNPLYVAALVSGSTAQCTALLTTGPSIKPILKTVLLSFKRYGFTLPKDVLLRCLAPYLIVYAAQQQMQVAKQLLTRKYQNTIMSCSNDWWAIPKTVVVEKPLYDMVKSEQLKELLNPCNLYQLEQPIIEELYTSIGISRK